MLSTWHRPLCICDSSWRSHRSFLQPLRFHSSVNKMTTGSVFSSNLSVTREALLAWRLTRITLGKIARCSNRRWLSNVLLTCVSSALGFRCEKRVQWGTSVNSLFIFVLNETNQHEKTVFHFITSTLKPNEISALRHVWWAASCWTVQSPAQDTNRNICRYLSCPHFTNLFWITYSLLFYSTNNWILLSRKVRWNTSEQS